MNESIENKQEENVFCRRCGRLLKDEESKKLGFGKKCYYIYKKELLEQSRLFRSGGTVTNEDK